jgi:hypothetical protein
MPAPHIPPIEIDGDDVAVATEDVNTDEDGLLDVEEIGGNTG